jgi:hypothetical protein
MMLKNKPILILILVVIFITVTAYFNAPIMAAFLSFTAYRFSLVLECLRNKKPLDKNDKLFFSGILIFLIFLFLYSGISSFTNILENKSVLNQ